MCAGIARRIGFSMRKPAFGTNDDQHALRVFEYFGQSFAQRRVLRRLPRKKYTVVVVKAYEKIAQRDRILDAGNLAAATLLRGGPRQPSPTLYLIRTDIRHDGAFRFQRNDGGRAEFGELLDDKVHFVTFGYALRYGNRRQRRYGLFDAGLEKGVHRSSVDPYRCRKAARAGIDNFNRIALAHPQHIDDFVRVASGDRNNLADFVASLDEESTQV
jgi:hypothetical protein